MEKLTLKKNTKKKKWKLSEEGPTRNQNEVF